MKKKCGNCKFWYEQTSGFPAYCQNKKYIKELEEKEKNNKMWSNIDPDKSLNNPNFCCHFHEFEEDVLANMIQYPSRFINNQ